MGRVSKYPPEFRERAVALVLDSNRSAGEVTRELGINHETLRNRVTKARRDCAAGPAALSSDERLELARLHRKGAELEVVKEILKKPRSSTPEDSG